MPESDIGTAEIKHQYKIILICENSINQIDTDNLYLEANHGLEEKFPFSDSNYLQSVIYKRRLQPTSTCYLLHTKIFF